MALFVIADLHLSADGSKSMEVFGPRWRGYTEKLEKNWKKLVSEGDTVILAGDISWGTRLEDALEDFAFLDSLPGQKLIGKGNHDFWWSTASKMMSFWKAHRLESLHILYNNAYLFDDCIVCGTRGWFTEELYQNTVGEVDYAKIVNREVIRLRLGLEEAVGLQKKSGDDLPILVFLHFPPVWNGIVCREIVDLLLEYGIKTCYFGHIHGAISAPRTTEFEGIRFILCSADALSFSPLPVRADDFSQLCQKFQNND